MALSEQQIYKLGTILMGQLFELSIQQKTIIAAKAGFDIAGVPNIASNPPVNSALYRAYTQLTHEEKQIALPIIATEIGRNRPDQQQQMDNLLKQHGYAFVDGVFVPAGLMDDREKPFIPASSVDLLTTAVDRLANGDENGAITAACGAVDTATVAIYQKYGLGPPPDSFQAKVNTVLSKLNIYDEISNDLQQIGLKQEDAHNIVYALHEATKQAANGLQVIRRSLGDVHGRKPTYTRLTYDTIKWASAICGLLEGKI
jgi:hypothetical protein